MLSREDLKMTDEKARALLDRLSKIPKLLSPPEIEDLDREARVGGALDPLLAELERFRDPSVVGEVSSHRRLLGKAVVMGKRSLLKVARPLLTESSRRQGEFNKHLLVALRAIDARLGRGEGSQLAALAGALNARLDTIDKRLDALEEEARRHRG